LLYPVLWIRDILVQIRIHNTDCILIRVSIAEPVFFV
jgi:hypothetical protein